MEAARPASSKPRSELGESPLSVSVCECPGGSAGAGAGICGTSCYIGKKKRNMQAVFTGCAANLKRTARWLAANDRKCDTRKAGH
jgi:hypothetical protein